MRKLIGSSILLCVPLLVVLGQEEVATGLTINPVAKKYYENYSPSKKNFSPDTLELPFIDDFSDSYVEPNPRLWVDKMAFINTSYPVSPITVGVATLDALDYDGSHYPHFSSSPYQADFLTSKPINLNYLPSDNVWLSFFYQPQGLGEMPEPQDSLCLDFYDPVNDIWINVWSVPGQALKPFERVMIQINDERFLQKGFQFRFRNYASLPDNIDFQDFRDNKDHWHIDYVYINKNRSAADTVLRDVAFTAPLGSILRDYEAIPWRHFEQAYFTQRLPFISVEYKNYDTIIRNVSRYLEMTHLYTGHRYQTQPTANDIGPNETTSYNIPYDYPFNFGQGDSASFLIRSILQTDAFDYKPNDTLSHIQKFGNYYALDDGTAEAGYGLRGLGTRNASVAVRFNSFLEDSLRAVDIYFNQLPDSSNLNYFFYLEVWENNQGVPGKLRHSQLGMRPKYSDEFNKFQRYYLDSTLAVNGTFFIGFTQTVEKLMNIGFDRNRNNSNRNHYTSGGVWSNSSIPGTIMMRPVIQFSRPVSTMPVVEKLRDFQLYPNPASDLLYISFLNENHLGTYIIEIIDLTGKTILRESISDQYPLDISQVKGGIYLVRLLDNRGIATNTRKIVITK